MLHRHALGVVDAGGDCACGWHAVHVGEYPGSTLNVSASHASQAPSHATCRPGQRNPASHSHSVRGVECELVLAAHALHTVCP